MSHLTIHTAEVAQIDDRQTKLEMRRVTVLPSNDYRVLLGYNFFQLSTRPSLIKFPFRARKQVQSG